MQRVVSGSIGGALRLFLFGRIRKVSPPSFRTLRKQRTLIMLTGKRLADMSYRAFSASMMLLTMYGGYLCVMRAQRYMERQKQLKLAAENQDSEVIKD